MIAGQALPKKGTRVEITDPEHDCFGERFEVVNTGLGGHFVEMTWSGTRFLTNGQFRVITQPEPTIGQLVDAMHAEIERICQKRKVQVIGLNNNCYYHDGDQSEVSVSFSDGERIEKFASTNQAALRAMIERLGEIQ